MIQDHLVWVVAGNVWLRLQKGQVELGLCNFFICGALVLAQLAAEHIDLDEFEDVSAVVALDAQAVDVDRAEERVVLFSAFEQVII